MSDDPKDTEAPNGPDAGEPASDRVVIPFRKRWQGLGKRLGDAEAMEPQEMDDGTLLDSVGRGWAYWFFDRHPRQSTCMSCFRQRRAEHEACGFEECDCFCMNGKLWPLWALFGLLPPRDQPIPPQLLGLGVERETGGPEQAHQKRPRVARTRRVAVAIRLSASAAVVLALVIGTRTPYGEQPAPSDSIEAASMAKVPDVQGQAVGAFPPDAGSIVSNLLGGLKMPDKPDPRWLKPDKDGVCRNQKTGEELRTQAVIRGTCWYVLQKMEGEASCPRWLYDPPPEVLNDKKLVGLHDACFRPWGVDGKPQAIER